jgi:hypothetical protein
MIASINCFGSLEDPTKILEVPTWTKSVSYVELQKRKLEGNGQLTNFQAFFCSGTWRFVSFGISPKIYP